MAQALIMFVVSLAMIPGWITPGIPVVLLFLSDYEPGPEAIQALLKPTRLRAKLPTTAWCRA
jgi:hypothetical protein